MTPRPEDAREDGETAIIRSLYNACDELMSEFVSKKLAANWGVINDAMYRAERFLASRARERDEEGRSRP